MRPKVSVIILHWNGLTDTLECLDSLQRLDYADFYIVLVDNGSEGDEASVLQETCEDKVHLLRNEHNLGYAGGNNVGIEFALANLDPDYLLVLNNDTVVDPAFLRELVNAMHPHPWIGIVGPKTLDYDRPDILECAGTRFNKLRGKVVFIGKGERDYGQYDHEKETDYIQGSCMLIRKEVVEAVGTFNEEYFLYWEDMEYCLRARRAGFSLAYCPSSRIWHKGSASSQKISGWRLYYGTRNRFFIYRDCFPRHVLAFFLLYYFGVQMWVSVFRLILEGRTGDILFMLKGIRDGLPFRRQRQKGRLLAVSES